MAAEKRTAETKLNVVKNQVPLTVTKPATDDAGEGDDYRTIGPSCAGTMRREESDAEEGHGK